MSSPRILDVGCGPGIYVDALQSRGLAADGIDIDPKTPYEKIDVFSEDFSRFLTGRCFPENAFPYDICLCLEVAEHLPEDRADEFVKKLTQVAPTVIFSAAVPGQGGHGHINCQQKEYWEEKFARLNYVQDTVATEQLVAYMKTGYHMGWFVNNVQVFKNYGSVCFEQIIAEEKPQAERLAEYLSTFKL
jgi:SAM-dependent methyltransferase